MADRAYVLIEKQRGSQRLAALSPSAARAGLEVGMGLAEARACLPDIATIAHDAEGDLALLARLAHMATRYSPQVAPDGVATILFDITGCAHLFGGETKMAGQIAAHFRKMGFTTSPALADTPDAARALARFVAADVRALPLAALRVDGPTTTALRRAGLRRVGDVAGLPRAALAARFGPGLVRQLARLLGEEDAHVAARLLPEPIWAERRFAEPVAHGDTVLAAVAVLLARLAVQMARSQVGGRAFALSLYRSDGHVAQLAVETGAPTRDAELVLRLLRERIDSLADPLDPGFGYDALTMAVPHAEALADHQPGLEEEARPRASLGALLDRLAVRHGAARILRFVSGNSHVPERAGSLRPHMADNDLHAGLATILDTGEPPTRPLLLFDPPQRLEVLASVPDGLPRRFRWRGRVWQVALAEGPERIAPEWWRRPLGHVGDAGLTRDYYRVEEEGGRRFWLFRHGLYGRESAEPRWYVHGLFA